MGNIELRELDDADPDDRDAFDAWIARNRALQGVLQFVVTENGRFVGTAATFNVETDREVSYWIAQHAWGRGVATAAMQLLISRDPVRPLHARVAVHNGASRAVLEKCGFTEVSRDSGFASGVGRDVEEIQYVLMPAIGDTKSSNPCWPSV